MRFLPDFRASLAQQFSGPSSQPQAVRVDKQDLANQRINKMLMENQQGHAARAARMPKNMAVRTQQMPYAYSKSLAEVPAAERRASRTLPKTTEAQRYQIVKDHFNKILSGRAGRMQGNK